MRPDVEPRWRYWVDCQRIDRGSDQAGIDGAPVAPAIAAPVYATTRWPCIEYRRGRGIDRYS